LNAVVPQIIVWNSFFHAIADWLLSIAKASLYSKKLDLR
jgi:hypothetical protein